MRRWILPFTLTMILHGLYMIWGTRLLVTFETKSTTPSLAHVVWVTHLQEPPTTMSITSNPLEYAQAITQNLLQATIDDN